MPTTIEALELQVQSNGASAVAGLDALSASLTKLKNATKGGVGLAGVANQIGNLNGALGSVNAAGAENVSRLADSLGKLRRLGDLKLSSSIGNQLTKIGTAATALNGVDFSGLGRMADAVGSLSGLEKSSGLQSAIKQLEKVPALAETLNKIDWATFEGNMQRLANSMAPLAGQANAVSAAFQGLPANIRGVVAATNALPAANTRSGKSYVGLAAKAGVAYVAMRRMSSVFSSLVTQSNKYIEDLNLFNVSMGEYAEQAHEYAEKVAEVMGIDPAEWMRNQGVFNTITKGFGVAANRAYTMSKNLTQLGYDLSSFYNISYEDAFQKLQSGIAGELEPLRRLGYDLSVARLQQEALNLGITKSVSAMTQAEKSELRYYAIMTQVTAAQGDMARTLTAPANQLRVLQAQVTQAARAFGNLFIPALNAVLPYAIAVVKVLRMIAQAIASLFHVKLPEVDYSGITAGAGAVGGLADSADGAAGALGGAAGKAKELKRMLLGIDELNVLPEQNAGTGGGAGVVGIGGSGLDFPLPGYDFLGDAVSNAIDDILKKWKDWLGLTDEIDTWTEFFHTRLGHILTTVGAIGLGLAAWKISKNVLDFMDWANKLKTSGLTSGMTIVVGISLLVTGVTLEWSGIIDAIQNELDGMNFAQIIGGGLFTVGGGAVLGRGLAGWITSAFADSAVAGALETAAGNLGLGTAGAAGAALGAGVAGIIAGVPAYLAGIWDALKNGLNWLNGLLIPAGSTAAAAGIGAIIGACGGPIGAGIGALIGLAVGLVTDGIIAITEHWDGITAWLDTFFTETVPGLWDSFKGWLDELFTVTIPGLWDSFVGWLQGLPEKISTWFDDLLRPVREFDWYALGQDIGYQAGTAIKSICDAVKTFFTETLPEVWDEVKASFKTFFTETLPTFFTETIPELYETIKTSFVEFFTVTLPDALDDIGEWFVDIGQAIWDGILEGWDTAVGAVTDFTDGLVDGFKDALGIHSPSTVFAELGGYLIEGLYGGMSGAWPSITGLISEGWAAVTGDTQTAWDSVTGWLGTTWDTISGKASGTWDTIKGKIGTAWGEISGNTAAVTGAMRDTVGTAFETMRGGIATAIGNASAILASTWANIQTNTAAASGNLQTALATAWSNMTRNTSSATQGLATTVSGTLTGLVNSAWSWGSDLANSIASGISSGISAVTSAASALAAKVRSYLHFSVPDVGPLSDFDTYMPDMLHEMASGIRSNEDTVVREVDALAANIAAGMQDALTAAENWSAGDMAYTVRAAVPAYAGRGNDEFIEYGAEDMVSDMSTSSLAAGAAGSRETVTLLRQILDAVQRGQRIDIDGREVFRVVQDQERREAIRTGAAYRW